MGTRTKTQYELPAVVAVALQSDNPEVLRALAVEASDQLKKLPVGEKANMVAELFKLIADMMTDKQVLESKLRVYEEIERSIQSAQSDIEDALSEANSRIHDIDRDAKRE